MRSYEEDAKTTQPVAPITTFREEIAPALPVVEVEVIPLGPPVDWRRITLAFALVVASVAMSVAASLLGNDVFPSIERGNEAQPVTTSTITINPTNDETIQPIAPAAGAGPVTFIGAAAVPTAKVVPGASSSASPSAPVSASATPTSGQTTQPATPNTTPDESPDTPESSPSEAAGAPTETATSNAPEDPNTDQPSVEVTEILEVLPTP